MVKPPLMRSRCLSRLVCVIAAVARFFFDFYGDASGQLFGNALLVHCITSAASALGNSAREESASGPRIPELWAAFSLVLATLPPRTLVSPRRVALCCERRAPTPVSLPDPALLPMRSSLD